MNKQILQDFIKTINFSKKNIVNRFLSKPFYVVYKVLFSKIYNLFFNNKTIFLSCKTFWGDKMNIVFPEDASLFHWGLVPGEEENLTEYIIRTIKPSWVVLDIGANHGYYSLLLSKIVGEGGQVYCFEPTPSTTKILKENTKNKSNIFIEEKAIWYKKQNLDFTDYGQGFSAYNSFLPNITWKDTENAKNKKKIIVNAITLDDYLKEKNIKIDFIKLDVEGAELEALTGMKKTLMVDSPIISVEFWVNHLWNIKNDRIINFFEEINYSCFKINRGIPEKIVWGDAHFDHDYTNLVFIKKK